MTTKNIIISECPNCGEMVSTTDFVFDDYDLPCCVHCYEPDED